jgi:hypothetical protein
LRFPAAIHIQVESGSEAQALEKVAQGSDAFEEIVELRSAAGFLALGWNKGGVVGAQGKQGKIIQGYWRKSRGNQLLGCLYDMNVYQKL